MSPCPRPCPRRPPGGRLVGLFTVVLLALCLALAGPVGPARAQDVPSDPVRVELDSMVPRVVTAGDTVTLGGTVTNTSADTLQAVQAYFWRDQQLRTTREELATGATAVGARYLPTFDILGNGGVLAPGQEVEFTVTMPASALGVATRDGVTLVGVQVRGSQGSGNVTLGRATAWLPQDVGTAADPVAVTSVVALSSRPSRLEAGLFLDDHLAAEVGEGGRLDTLLTEAGRSGHSWLVDPALLVALRDMADDDGYALADGSVGAGAAAARTWLDGYAALGTEGRRLPYAAADIALLGALDRPELLHAASSAPAVPEDVAVLPLAAWPADGVLTEEGLAALAGLDSPVTVLAANIAATSTTPDRTVVAYDPTALVPDPTMDDTVIQRRQHIAATTFLDSIAGRGSQVRLVTDAAAAGVDATDATVRTPLSQVSGEVGLPLLPEQPTDVSEERLGHVSTAADERAGLAQLYTDPESAADANTRIVAALAGTGWDDPAAYAAFRSWERGQSERILRGDAVVVSAQPILLTAREDTPFPVTVTNNLSRSVSVRVVFSSENSDRLRVPAVDVPPIGPGESVGVTVVPQVAANGRYTVVAQLTTLSGRPVGQPVDIEVQATQAGRVGWILMIVSGLVVVGTTVLRVKQVRSERSNA